VRKWLLLLGALIVLLCIILAVHGCGGGGKKEYDLTIAASPTAGGTISPAPGVYTFDRGTVITIVATPAPGWEFTGWSGSASGTRPSITVTMDSDKLVTANFAKIVPTYTLTTEKVGKGTVRPLISRREYDEGTAVTLTATPRAGWKFVNWTGDVASPTSSSTTVTMDADKRVTANFVEIPTYTLTIAKTGKGAIRPLMSRRKFDAGTVVTLTAIPRTNWKFVNWTGDVASPSSASTTVTMDGDKTVIANFVERPIYTLTIAKVGKGTTTPAVKTHISREGHVMTITALPTAGWRFGGWSGDVSGTTASIEVTMDADKRIVANFVELPVYTLTIASEGKGSTKPSAKTRIYRQGEVVTVTALPATGYKLHNWSGDVSGTTASIQVTMNADKRVTANFVSLVTYTLTMAASPEDGGAITPAAGVSARSGGEKVKITAIPAPGWKFDGWSGDVAKPTSAGTTVTMDADKTVTANFSPLVRYTLTMAVDDPSHGTTTPPPGPSSRYGGEKVKITAVAAPGWAFVNWSGDVDDPTKASTTVTVSSDKTVTANFAKTYTLTLDIDPEEGGNTTPKEGEYAYVGGTVVTITAKPKAGWKFVEWTGEIYTVDDPEAATTTVVVDGDYYITANFREIEKYTLLIYVDGEGTTTPPAEREQTYVEGTVVNIIAKPKSGWKFVEWIGDVDTVEDVEAANTTITMDSDCLILAIFEPI